MLIFTTNIYICAHCNRNVCRITKCRNEKLYTIKQKNASIISKMLREREREK